MAKWNEFTEHVQSAVRTLAHPSDLVLAPNILTHIPRWIRSNFSSCKNVFLRSLHEWVRFHTSKLLIHLQPSIPSQLIINNISLPNNNHRSWDLFSRFQNYGLHVSFCVTLKFKSVHILLLLDNDFDPITLMPSFYHFIDLFAKAFFYRRLLIAY